MPGSDRKKRYVFTIARISIAATATLILAVKMADAQDVPSAVSPAVPGYWVTRLPGFSGLSFLQGTTIGARRPVQASNSIATGFGEGGDYERGPSGRSGQPRRI